MADVRSGDRPRVLIVGAGVSGLGVARRLRSAGIPFTVLEKAPAVGGTWWHSRYPGLKCDVPVVAYRYSFEGDCDWQSMLPRGPELQQRLERLCDEHGLRPHIRFGTEVVDARWTADRWVVRTRSGEAHEAEVLLLATGFLHHPHTPDIPGLDEFDGPVVHSGRWDDRVELDGRRVAVIGSGSSGCQLVTGLGGRAARVFMFNRTPQWVLPVPDLRIPAPLTAAMRRWRPFDRAVRSAILAVTARILGYGSTRNGWERRLFTWLCRRNLRTVRDPALRAALTPTDPPLCKRPVMSTEFYPAIQRPDVELVRGPIDRVTPTGIRTEDGRDIDLDVLVLATGYQSQAYMRPMEVRGVEGVRIAEVWRDVPFAYRSFALPGFPNLFLTYGPLAPRLHVGVHETVELFAGYVVEFVESLERLGCAGLAPSKTATDDWVGRTRDAAKGTYLASCRSWYQGADGVPLVYTLPRKRWRETVTGLDLDDFERTPKPARTP